MLKNISINSEQNDMTYQNRVTFIIFLLLFISCSRDNSGSQLKPGLTTLNSLFENHDEPLNVIPASRPDQEIFVYENMSVQVDDQMVRAVYRNPASNEKNLQFWRHKYRTLEPSFKPVARTDEQFWQLKYNQQGINIIYNSQLDEVVRIIEYELPR